MGFLLRKPMALGVGIIFSLFLTQYIIHTLSLYSLSGPQDQSIYSQHILVALLAFSVPFLLGWYGYEWIGINVFSFFVFPLIIFVVLILGQVQFIWVGVFFFGLIYSLHVLKASYVRALSSINIEKEKFQNEINHLEVSYRQRGEGISTFFEKYSTYYNLRKLAEEITAIFSVSELTQKVIEKTVSFIPRGKFAVITLAHEKDKDLPVIAQMNIGSGANARVRQGSAYDHWAIRNRKRLIVMDATTDFRFALKDDSADHAIRSLIVSPLFHEGRVMGTIGVYSEGANSFTHDDLRLLDAIAALASSGVSNAMLYERTKELAIKDSLTGLYVRRYFYERFKEEHRRSLINKRPLSLLMCDLDYFKRCNDEHGHQAGDLMLVEFARVLQSAVPDMVCARFGGEEFAVLCPETDLKDAVEVAERIRKTVESESFNIRRVGIKMTVSIGVAGMPQDTLELQSLLEIADKQLYRAKNQGRNQVCSQQQV